MHFMHIMLKLNLDPLVHELRPRHFRKCLQEIMSSKIAQRQGIEMQRLKQSMHQYNCIHHRLVTNALRELGATMYITYTLIAT